LSVFAISAPIEIAAQAKNTFLRQRRLSFEENKRQALRAYPFLVR